MRNVLAALTCAVALAVGPAEAGAQGQGVIVDPESPSGKQYAIPLESARRQADPREVSPTVASRAGSAALFGEGVVAPIRSGGQSQDRRGVQRSKEKDRRETRSADPAPRAVPDVVGIAASGPAAPDGGIGTPMLVLGLGLVVVLTGVGAGVAIRRRAGGE